MRVSDKANVFSLRLDHAAPVRNSACLMLPLAEALRGTGDEKFC